VSYEKCKKNFLYGVLSKIFVTFFLGRGVYLKKKYDWG